MLVGYEPIRRGRASVQVLLLSFSGLLQALLLATALPGATCEPTPCRGFVHSFLGLAALITFGISFIWLPFAAHATRKHFGPMPWREASLRGRLWVLDDLPRPLAVVAIFISIIAMMFLWGRLGLNNGPPATRYMVAVAVAGLIIAVLVAMRPLSAELRALIGRIVLGILLGFGFGTLAAFTQDPDRAGVAWVLLGGTAYFSLVNGWIHAVIPPLPDLTGPLDMRRLDVAEILTTSLAFLLPTLLVAGFMAFNHQVLWPLLIVAGGLMISGIAAILHRSRGGWVFLPLAWLALLCVPPLGWVQAIRILWALRPVPRGGSWPHPDGHAVSAWRP